jgi:hypothetical protein
MARMLVPQLVPVLAEPTATRAALARPPSDATTPAGARAAPARGRGSAPRAPGACGVAACCALVLGPARVAAQTAGAGATPDEARATSEHAASSASATSGSSAPVGAASRVDATAPPPPPVEDRSPHGLEGFYQDGRVFLHERVRDLWISPGARVHTDGVLFIGDGILDSTRTALGTFRRADLADTLLLRRARLELMFGGLGRFTGYAAMEFASPVPVQNGEAFAPAQGPQLHSAWLNARIDPLLQVMAGQFNAPFSMENRTDANALDTPERSLFVRGLAVPFAREVGAMLWGEDRGRVFTYEVGAFLGDGPNRMNRDGNWDAIGRVMARPFLHSGTVLANLQLGASGWYGTRGASTDYPYASMQTPGGFQFFRTTAGSGDLARTVVPDGEQWAVAGELDLPFRRFDLRVEGGYVSHGTREMAAPSTGGPSLAGDAVRLGWLRGWGGYLELAYWLQGDIAVNGRPGVGYRPAVVDASRRAAVPVPMGLQVLLRGEIVQFVYDADVRGTTVAPAEVVDRAGFYQVLGLAAGVNWWVSPHVRLTTHYEQYFLGELPPNGTLSFDDNHALGPRNARGPVGTFGELTFRAAAQF